ncbi:MAG TPA: hypothetical protein VG733_17025 [Chthoniobacteraceae bacterium]|nr:hypothetical protein [Chthoniobacteraceae bacterium]
MTYSSKVVVAVENLKARLQTRYERCLPEKTGQIGEVLHAAEVAAWDTQFPHLFLPELADEGISRLVATQPAGAAARDALDACLACAA